MIADAILDIINASCDPLDANEIASRACMSPKTARKYLNDLVADKRIGMRRETARIYFRLEEPTSESIVGAPYQQSVFATDLTRDFQEHWKLAMSGPR